MAVTSRLSQLPELLKGIGDEAPLGDYNEDGSIGKLHSTVEEGMAWKLAYDQAWAYVENEVKRQVLKWGVQKHPSFELTDGAVVQADVDARHHIPSEADAKFYCERYAERGQLTWQDILQEEVSEALGAAYEYGADSDEVFSELVQSAAVLVNWIADIINREHGALLREHNDAKIAAQADNPLVKLLMAIQGENDGE